MVRHQADIYFVGDKAKIPIGKPGCPTSTGMRGKKMIAPTSSILSALDHDIEALGNIIPTVFQQPEIPEKLEGSWYRGKVSIDVHDAVFQQSSTYRYPATVIKMSGQAPMQIVYPTISSSVMVELNIVPFSLKCS